MNTFNEKVVKENTLKFFNNDELATTVWLKKYALRNENNEFVEKDPKARFLAISKDIVRMDEKYNNKIPLTVEMIMKLLLDKKFLFGGSILFGAANPYSTVSLSNCFVISGNSEDSYGSIFRTDEEIAQISKRRGGTGLDISHLRPKYSIVNNAAKTSTGPISFAERFSNTTREVAQDGRRGALMLTMHVNHPDILEFITMKDNDDKITGANVSIKITDEFMQAVKGGFIHQLRFPVDIPTVIGMDPLSNPLNTIIESTDGIRINVRARDIFDKLVEVNHKRAEPGLLFWDHIIRDSPADKYKGFQSISTNPCGELPLSAYDSCRLTSINLTSFVSNPFTKHAKIAISDLLEVTEMVTRIMDNIVDLEIEKIEKIIEKINTDPEDLHTKNTELNLWTKILIAAKNGRRLGISLIGHGDFLAMLGNKYGSTKSNDLLSTLHKAVIKRIYHKSIDLAKSRGAFPTFKDRIYQGSFFSKIADFMEEFNEPRRNISVSTIPPSGSLSILLDNQSSGIEPVFALWYTRRRKVTDEEEYDFIDATGDKFITYHVFHPNFIKWAEINGISKEELEKDPEGYAKKSPYYGSTSEELDPIKKIKMQGIIQTWIDHSISSTINLKEDTTLEEVHNIYIQAWEEGLKGVTVYRAGSRDGILQTTKKTTETFEQRDAPKRPRELECDIFHPSIRGEKFVVIVGLMDEKPYEVFALQKNGMDISTTISKGIIRKQKSKHWVLLDSDDNVLVKDILKEFKIPSYEFATKMISTALRHGAAIDFVVDQLNDTEGIITDYAKVIARQLKKYTKGLSKKVTLSDCPVCGETLKIESGCATCINLECGYSACS